MAAPNSHKMIIRNISGKKRYFGYLGPRGAELLNGADIALNGNLWEQLSRKQIQLDAFKRDLQNGVVAIVKTTDVYAYDTANTVVRVLGVNAGSFQAKVPAEGSYSGPASTA